MPSNELSCPIWEDAPNATRIVNEYARRKGYSANQVFEGIPVMPCDSPRAGGRFQLKKSGADLLPSLTDRQKANLSYWIYHHNLRYRLLDASPDSGEAPIVLDQGWVENNRDRTPLNSDRMLTFLRELIRSNDVGEPPNRDLWPAAGGCRHNDDLQELMQYGIDQKWMTPHAFRINLSTRIYVEEQLGVLGRERQGFVAMWFDKSTEKAFKCGIEPAIEDAGYKARRIDQKEFLGKVDDEIVAEIRKSRFVVADFTTSKKAGARGGVYYEAGFAQGLGIDVIYTCRKDRMKAVHFDTNHFNHITWKKPKDLREQLQHRIEAILGRGPLDPSTEQRGRIDDALNEDS